MRYALLGILIYIALRFDFTFAPGAIVALVHDVLITMGIFSFFGEFDLPILAALLTIVGYSSTIPSSCMTASARSFSRPARDAA